MTTLSDECRSALEELSPDLLEAYQGWKEMEGLKNTAKDGFFRLADDAAKHNGLALKLVDITALSQESALARVKRHYPGWTVDEIRPHRVIRDSYEAVLKEDPAFQPFSFEHEGWKLSRTVSKGSVMLDDEWLQEEDPEAYEQAVYALPWGGTVMRPLETLDKDLIGRITKYLYNDKLRVSLAPPREVKGE